MLRTLLVPAAMLASFGAILLAASTPAARADDSAGKDRVFEMRTYHCHEGRLPALHKRFQDHTIRIFKKHGIESIGYWIPADEKQGKANTLVYIVAYPSREAAKKSWEDFRNDPEWKKVAADSEKDGKIVEKIESVYLTPAEYSQIK